MRVTTLHIDCKCPIIKSKFVEPKKDLMSHIMLITCHPISPVNTNIFPLAACPLRREQGHPFE